MRRKPPTEDEFLQRFYDRNKYAKLIIFLSPFIDMYSPRLCKCTVCGREWWTETQNLCKKHHYSRCPTCKYNSMKLTHARFLELFSLNPHFKKIKINSEYKGHNHPIDCECLVCGHKWSPKATNLINKSNHNGCPECARIALCLTNEEFISTVNDNNYNAPYITITSKYTTSTDIIDYTCNHCGAKLQAPANKLMYRNQGCTVCSGYGTSFVEQLILHVLQVSMPTTQIVSRDRRSIGMELDIFIPDKNIAIEVNGWHWHKDKLNRDLEKYNLCQEKGINLITIYDACPDPTHGIPNSYSYPISLPEEPGHKQLKELICILVEEISNIQISPNFNWVDAMHTAAKYTLRKTKDEVQELMDKTNPYFTHIEILEYYGTQTKTTLRCTKCGTVWHPKGSYLIPSSTRKVKCPTCDTRSGDKLPLVRLWRSNNPDGTPKECSADLDLHIGTISKHWDAADPTKQDSV